MKRVRLENLALLIMACGWIGLGLISLLNKDFLSNWQPVARDMPFREPLALASGLILLLGGLGLLYPKARKLAALILAVDVLLWIVALQLPAIVPNSGQVGAWLPLCEDGVLFAGALTVLNGQTPGGWLPPIRFLSDGGGRPWARYIFAACCLVFGLSHFVYAQFTSAMIPVWLPEKLALAYLTGACHFAAGVAILLSVLGRWAARLEAAMMSGFVLLVHVPSVLAHPLPVFAPTPEAVWMLLLIALTLSGSAWAVAAAIPDRKARPEGVGVRREA